MRSIRSPKIEEGYHLNEEQASLIGPFIRLGETIGSYNLKNLCYIVLPCGQPILKGVILNKTLFGVEGLLIISLN